MFSMLGQLVFYTAEWSENLILLISCRLCSCRCLRGNATKICCPILHYRLITCLSEHVMNAK